MEQSLYYPVHGAMDLEAETGFVFRQARREQGYAYLAREQWQVAEVEDWTAALTAVSEPLLVGTEVNGDQQAVYACVRRPDAVVHVTIEVRVGDRPVCRASVAAASVDAAAAHLEEIRGVLPEVDPQLMYELPVAFWNQGQFGADRRERALEPLRWDALAGNYPGELGAQLAALVGADAEAIGARLHLWHGPPGTGKTHAVRMLATAWREWCELHYITDPEQFFASAEYMMDVVLGSSSDWRLVVVHDAGLTEVAPMSATACAAPCAP